MLENDPSLAKKRPELLEIEEGVTPEFIAQYNKVMKEEAKRKFDLKNKKLIEEGKPPIKEEPFSPAKKRFNPANAPRQLESYQEQIEKLRMQMIDKVRKAPATPPLFFLIEFLNN